MAHCTKCGAEVPDAAQFCQKCGQPQIAGPASPGIRFPAPPYQPATSGLSENAAATLSYVLGWLTGIIFFLIDNRPYVRFHAAQSIVTFGGLHIIRAMVGVMFGLGWAFHGWGPWGGYGVGHFAGFGIGLTLLIAIGFVTFVLWIVCMVKAFQGERFMVPIAGDIAANLAGR
ncbi:MAG: zinc-ribbon domain-containing protein [Candidatus Korobacteraceae bacterium]